jgi:hypothetical protein
MKHGLSVGQGDAAARQGLYAPEADIGVAAAGDDHGSAAVYSGGAGWPGVPAQQGFTEQVRIVRVQVELPGPLAGFEGSRRRSSCSFLGRCP